jgi:hypothetical protein
LAAIAGQEETGDFPGILWEIGSSMQIEAIGALKVCHEGEFSRDARSPCKGKKEEER